MKKSFLGGIILAALFILSLINIHFLDNFTGELLYYIDSSQQLAGDKNYASAAEELQKAITLWNDMEGYTHIFIRHSEIDSTADAFYELFGDLVSQSDGTPAGSFAKLRARIESIAGMEHISLGSIF